MDNGLTVYARLEHYAERGQISCELNLYKRQIEKLLKNGLAVQPLHPMTGYKGQYRCMIGWRYAMFNTVAWHLLEISAEHNESLKKALNEPEEIMKHVNKSKKTGWFEL